ncbi:hypothetical protein [Parabacteroides chinchillae]|uniref:Por secretion system C-terminal sorting domain-containing protein n=1 Tax=Parabacteroides chinchillae TaxID=871327 RepID=A0A8G2F0A2_9BACT|nr:hypothetical protein [Parabacteroides chinchillae]SEF43208.1 hypothetical protein SAMN05444001_101166 [Parabacteroides chinchillae]
MKKIFTFISALVMLFATTFTGSAQNQPQLTNAEKAAIVKEIVPAIFDQVKTISGVDFMALTNPTIEGIVSSPLFFQQGLATRAATPTVIDVIPDSMNVDLSSIKMTGMPDAVSSLLKKVKLTFSESKDFTFAMGVRPVSIKIPHKIVASIDVLGELLTVSFTSGDKGTILPYSSFRATLSLSPLLAGLGSSIENFPLKAGDLLSIEETKGSNGILSYSIVMEDALRGMVSSLAEVPNFMVTLDMTKLMTAGTIKASLFGKPLQAPTASILMGDATVYANLKSTTGMPVEAIVLASYGTDSKINGYRKLTPVISVNGANMLLTTTNEISAVPSADTNGDGVVNSEDLEWTKTSAQVITMPASLSTTFGNMMSSLVAGIIGNLKADMNQNIDITIDSVYYESETAKPTINVMAINVKTTLEAISLQESNVIVNVTMKTRNESNTLAEAMAIKATVPTADQKIKIEFTPAGSDTPMATAFVKSNALGVITSNEASPVLEDANVYVQEGGIYVENCDKATYSVVSINGAKLTNGIISGTNEYIAIPSLAKDNIYIVTIIKDNARKSFKIKAN